MSLPPYRDGKVHVLREKCSTCVFRPGNLMHLSPGRLKELIETNLAAEAAFSCHQTLPAYGTAAQALCRGYVDRYRQHVPALRLATAIDAFKEVEPPDVDHRHLQEPP
jgi:hypothetical protein